MIDEVFWGRVYEKAEYNRLFIQLLKKTIPAYQEILYLLR